MKSKQLPLKRHLGRERRRTGANGGNMQWGKGGAGGGKVRVWKRMFSPARPAPRKVLVVRCARYSERKFGVVQHSSAVPSKNHAAGSRITARSASLSARTAFCSTRMVVMPWDLISAGSFRSRPRMTGAKPLIGLSSSKALDVTGPARGNRQHLLFAADQGSRLLACGALQTGKQFIRADQATSRSGGAILRSCRFFPRP